MTDSAKKNAKALSKDTKTAIKNFVRLVKASALLAVSIYSGVSASQHDFSGFYKLLLVAAVLIGLEGADLFLKHLANK